MRCHPAIGSNLIFVKIDVLGEFNNVSIGYLLCPKQQVSKVNNRKYFTYKITENLVKDKCVTLYF